MRSVTLGTDSALANHNPAKTGQDKHLKLSPQSHILFYKVFFDKEYTGLPHCPKCPKSPKFSQI